MALCADGACSLSTLGMPELPGACKACASDAEDYCKCYDVQLGKHATCAMSEQVCDSCCAGAEKGRTVIAGGVAREGEAVDA